MQELMDMLGAPAISKPSLAIVFVAPEGIKEVQVAFGAEVCHGRTGISRSTEPRRCRQNMSTGNTTAKLLPVVLGACCPLLKCISCIKSIFSSPCTVSLQPSVQQCFSCYNIRLTALSAAGRWSAADGNNPL
jgi:hypothetical protein